jgi:hypothetical protein
VDGRTEATHRVGRRLGPTVGILSSGIQVEQRSESSCKPQWQTGWSRLTGRLGPATDCPAGLAATDPQAPGRRGPAAATGPVPDIFKYSRHASVPGRPWPCRNSLSLAVAGHRPGGPGPGAGLPGLGLGGPPWPNPGPESPTVAQAGSRILESAWPTRSQPAAARRRRRRAAAAGACRPGRAGLPVSSELGLSTVRLAPPPAFGHESSSRRNTTQVTRSHRRH